MAEFIVVMQTEQLNESIKEETNMINNPVVISAGGGGDNHHFRQFYNRMGQ